MQIRLGSLYLDLVQQETSAPVIRLINRDPEPGSPLEGQRGAPVDTAIRLTIAAVGATAALSGTGTVVYVTVNGGAAVAAFTNAAGPAFDADYAAGSTYTAQASPGAGADDEQVLKLVRATPFASLDVVVVRVVAATTGVDTLDESYEFVIEDVTASVILTASTRGLRVLRVLFDEPVSQDGTAGSSLYFRDVSGGVEFISQGGLTPGRLRAPNGQFTSADVGMYVGVARADEGLNNGYARIASVIDAANVALDRPVATEAPSTITLAFVSPYRIRYLPPAAPTVEVGFTPVIRAVEPVPSIDLTPGADVRRYVDLVLQDDLSPGRSYALDVAALEDLFGNVATDVEIEFTAEALPDGRSRYDLWSLIPDTNKRDDASRDLERLVRCFDEPFQLMRSDADRLAFLVDPDNVPASALDALLGHLGNPFTFSMTDLEKRRLASVLIGIHERKGIEDGMEDALNYLVPTDPNPGPLDVEPFLAPEDTWLLGVSELGVDTFLGPGTSFQRFSFVVESGSVLTEEQRFRILEIVEYMRPAWTHYVQLIEPIPSAPPPPTTFWILGESALGETTVLSG